MVLLSKCINEEHFELLPYLEKNEDLGMAIHLLACITLWSKYNNKTADRSLKPKSLGGLVDMNDFEVKYTFLKIIGLPLDKKEIEEDVYQCLIDINNSIFVKYPHRVGYLSAELK